MKLVKVNGVCSAAQAARLASRADILGICIGPRDEAPFVSVGTAKAIRDAMGGARLAVAADNLADLEDVGADYYDLIPVDYAKADAFAAELLRLRAIPVPKIARGFFVLADERSFIAESAPFERLCDAGVELFELEVEAAASADAERFCARFACLTAGAPVVAAKGVYFDLRPRAGDPGHAEADVVRAVREMKR